MRRPWHPLRCALFFVAVFTFGLPIVGVTQATAQAQAADHPWVAVWGSSQMTAEGDNALPAAVLDDATLRQIVRVTAAGDRIRVRLSNAFGSAPLQIASATVAEPGSGSTIVPGSSRPLLFNGRPGVVIPTGADYLSDPVEMSVTALGDIAVSLHVLDVEGPQTGHPGSRATSFVGPGDQTSAAEMSDAETVSRWYFIAGIEASGPAVQGAIVILGDSITDGYGVALDSNTRWPDLFAARLQAQPATRGLSVINQGIGGNRLLRDGLGPNALARFERDVLSQPGVSHVVVLEGVNDLGVLTRDQPMPPEAHAALVEQMIGVYRQMVIRARTRGVRIIGATIMPYAGSAYYHPTAENEADRQALNAWIRTPGNFDAVIAFDQIMADPARPDHMNPAYDLDGLHPSVDGYRAMADAIPLSIFEPAP